MHIMPCVASKRLVHQTIWIVFEHQCTLVEGVEVDLQYDANTIRYLFRGLGVDL